MIGQGQAIVLAPSTLIAQPTMAETRYTLLEFADLSGWSGDDHDAALEVFRNTCMDLEDPDWRALCGVAGEVSAARPFFETMFKPVLIEDGSDGLLTGYYEPELNGALRPDDRYRYPLYRLPPTRPQGGWPTRREIEEDGVLNGQGLEILWVDDPVALYFLHIQGSGRVRLPDGQVRRVGYGGKNGHEYRSVGLELISRGIFEEHEVSADGIGNWVRRNPEEGPELLWTNASYVFFREVDEVPADKGPLGAMNRSITPGRSLAVDPAYVPLGAPVWMERGGDKAQSRLMIAQDTGSAIRGAQRADLFVGTGADAGREAGQIKDPLRLVALMPIQRAYALSSEHIG